MKRTIETVINATLNTIKFFEVKIKSAIVIKGIKRSIQIDNFSCGAHCAYMIVNYYNKKMSLDKIIKKLKTVRTVLMKKQFLVYSRKKD